MDLEATFQQFRRTREPGALGAVFDATADDLFGLALHLTRDHAMAEDVLQATFLVAIERAHRWQPDRPLRPWLLGILHREVKVARRRARRTPDGSRVATKPSEPPEIVLLAAEVRDAVRVALGELPEPYRGVVDLHLVQALSPAAIVARLQRSSGKGVRTEELVVRLPRPGRLRCRVLRGDGTPAAGAWLVLQREVGVEDPFAPGWQGATDGDGWRTFDDVEPVPLQVMAWASREAGVLQVAPVSQPIVVRPGQESEVVVVLAQ